MKLRLVTDTGHSTSECSLSDRHRTRQDYDEIPAALADARLVLHDLLEVLDTGALLVQPDDLRFLARRADSLVAACQRVIESEVS